jgi:uncharacterized protein (TIGR03086 family)
MSAISERYRRLSEEFARKVDAVPDDRWEAPSPCEEWTTRDVVKHVAETPGMFYGFIGQEPPVLPEDPVAALTETRRHMQAALDDPATAATEFTGMFGLTTFETAVDRFVNFDLLIHGWDLARAAGLDESITDEDLDWLEPAAKAFGDAARAPGVFGPELEAPANADRQTELLAFLGRRA